MMAGPTETIGYRSPTADAADAARVRTVVGRIHQSADDAAADLLRGRYRTARLLLSELMRLALELDELNDGLARRQHRQIAANEVHL